MSFFSFNWLPQLPDFSHIKRNEQMCEAAEEVRKAAYSLFYQDFRKDFLRKMRRKYQLSEIDAKDLYQEAFLKMWAKSQEGRHFETTPEAWLVQLAKGILFNQRKKKGVKNTEFVYDWQQFDTQTTDEEQHEKNVQKIYQLLHKSSSKTCQELLEWAFLEDLSHAEIAEIMDYRNADTVKAQKSRCLEKLRAWVEKNQLSVEDFFR